MRKFLTLLAVVLVAAQSASAQTLRYGVVGAANFSTYSMDAVGFDISTDSRVGFKVGFRMEIDAQFLMKGLYFDMETALSSKGAKYTGTQRENYADISSRPYYLEMPMHIGYHYRFSESDVGVFGSFGPYLGVGLFGTDKYMTAGRTDTPDTFSDDNLKRFDFGLGVRLGVSIFDHYRVVFGYDWGLVDISQIEGVDINNRNFYIGAAYMF